MLLLRIAKLFLWIGFNLVIILYLISAFRVRVPVLCFHEILESPSSNPLSWQKQRFESLINKLKALDYDFILPDTLVLPNDYLTRKQIILTFDDGTRDHLEIVLPLLNKHDISGLFFWIGSELLNLDSNQRESLLKNLGNSKLGSHTTQWKSLLGMTKAQRLKEFDQSEIYLRNFVAYPINNFAFPKGEYDPNLASMALKRFKNVFSVDLGYFWPGRHKVHGRYMLNSDTTDQQIEEYLSRSKPFQRWDFWLLLISLIMLNFLLILRKRLGF